MKKFRTRHQKKNRKSQKIRCHVLVLLLNYCQTIDRRNVFDSRNNHHHQYECQNAALMLRRGCPQSSRLCTGQSTVPPTESVCKNFQQRFICGKVLTPKSAYFVRGETNQLHSGIPERRYREHRSSTMERSSCRTYPH